MAFIQFHPTSLYEKGRASSFLISEAVRGMGGILRNHKGEAFMRKYDPRKDLATRDIVSRAICQELKESGEEHLYLDCTRISKADFTKHFPTIFHKCVENGTDPTVWMIPVVPSAHYCCGGIHTNAFGKTSIENLYALGECAYTGLHGANRLASNSLLEALVFAHRCHIDTSARMNVRMAELREIQHHHSGGTDNNSGSNISAIKKTMSANAGILTSNEQLAEALETLKKIKSKNQDMVMSRATADMRNILDTALLIVTDAITRKKNRGVFFNSSLEKKYKRHTPKTRDINRVIV